MELYNEFKIAGEIIHIAYKKSKAGNGYVDGIVANYDGIDEDDKRTNFMGMSFIAFGDQAIQMETANVKKDDILIMNGKIIQNFYNEKTTLKLVIEGLNFDTGNVMEPNRKPQVQPQKKQETKLDFPEDDFPF
jgi:hypothetical protein